MATNKANITIRNAKFLRVDNLTTWIIWGVGEGWKWETSQNANVKLTYSNIHQQKMSFIWNDFMLLRKNSICSPDLNTRMLAIIVLFLQHMDFFVVVLFNFVFIVHVHFYSQTCSWCISYANNLQAAKMSVTSKLE